MEKKLHHLNNQLKGELHLDALHKAIYATDASVYRKTPLAVAFPQNEQDIVKLVQFATKNNTSLIPRTAGTSLAGQCVGEGIVVDVSKHFTEIIAIDIENRTVTVQPGVIRDELNKEVKPHGLFFGPNTSTSNRCMIGGMVGNNSSGTTSIAYGVTRDKVISMQTVLSDGSQVAFRPLTKEQFIAKTKLDSLEGNIYKQLWDSFSSEIVQQEIIAQFPKPEIHRRNTGYALDALIDNSTFGKSETLINICKLLCGSEGTLAFTTEVTLQLDPLPPVHTAMIAAHYNSLEESLLDVPELMKTELHACEMIDDVILDCTKGNKKYNEYRFFVNREPKTLLLLELRETSKVLLQSKIDAALNRINSTKRSYANPVLTGKEIDMAMELRKAGLGLLGNMVGDRKAVACIEDTAVSLKDLPNYIKEFSQLMEGYGQDAVYYAHAGAGELHLRPILNLKEKEDVAFFRKITTDVAQLVKKYKGSFSGEHGDGIVRAEFLEFMIGKKNYQLCKDIKHSFDSNNIFNPGKIVDAYRMDEDLRYTYNHKTPQVETLLNFDDSQGLVRLAEKCNGSGDCRKPPNTAGTMCPSYRATLDEKDSTRARANMLREVLNDPTKTNKFDSEELKQVFDLCISCKACATECPSNVDMATAKAEFQYQYRKSNGVSRKDKLFGKSSSYNRIAGKVPGLANWLFSNKLTSRVIKNASGIAKERSIPKLSVKRKLFRYSPKPYEVVEKYQLYLFIDEFSNYLENKIAVDAYELLVQLGYNVGIIDSLDSARALISKGFLEEAKVEVDTNVSVLKTKISANVPLVGIEPSAILGFRDEYLRLASDVDSAIAISENTYLIEEFLASEIEKGTIKSSSFTSVEKEIKIHVHCHQKALSNQKVTFDILNLPQNYKPTLMTTGCCGMAGSFGYEKEHYEVSMQIGELRLFPSIRKARETTIIAANGTSCRHQIKDGTQRDSLHPVTILRRALI